MGFNFAHPYFLSLGLFIPFIWILFFWSNPKRNTTRHLGKFIDSHLLPYLLVESPEKKRGALKVILAWSLAWGLLTMALAGPRWNLRIIETYTKDQSLVIILDLSESMNADDIKPSRLVRAKQKLDDLLQLSKGAKLGLIAFAADPHMITPLTDDKETLRHLLPSLDTDLVYVQGSRLTPALEMADAMLQSEPGENKGILVITDGGFEDSSALSTVKKLNGKGIAIHAMGIGTTEGTALKNAKGHLLKKNGTPLISKMEKERLQEISRMGRGHYFEGGYEENPAILFEETDETRLKIGQKKEIWEEGFYWVLLPVVPFFLWWFRKGSLFALLALFSLSSLEGKQLGDYFKNSEQLGEQAFMEGSFVEAEQLFVDPYHKGVASYRAGNYPEAEKNFKQSQREEVAIQSVYNLGNTFAMQQKFKEAIAAYEKVLEMQPDHRQAKENLELIKKLQEKQNQQDQKQQDKQQESEEQEQSENEKENPEPQPDNEKEPQPEKQQGEDEKKEAPTPKGQPRSEADQDADQWLNQIENEPKDFLKNKFYIESKKNGTKEGVDPW